ncbi:MAG: hypothetical protein MI757_14040 [Pirellulales bacterium]|nr:hypothetical protein [Pirellulales bacterium]
MLAYDKNELPIHRRLLPVETSMTPVSTLTDEQNNGLSAAPAIVGFFEESPGDDVGLTIYWQTLPIDAT